MSEVETDDQVIAKIENRALVDEIKRRRAVIRELAGNMARLKNQMDALQAGLSDQISIINLRFDNACMREIVTGRLDKEIEIPDAIDPDTGELKIEIAGAFLSW